jgi:hypothetical protein
MPSRRFQSKPKSGEEIVVSVLGIETREEMLWISSMALAAEDFPPCIRNILQARIDRGRHRAAAILAAFLGQAGWNEGDARNLWSSSIGAGIEERIFTEWFGKMHCPKCETLKRRSDGYPDLGIADLDLCLPDERCRDFQGPVEHAAKIKTEEDRPKGSLLHIKTLHHARIFDWSSGREGEIELSDAEKLELLALLKEQAEGEDMALVYTRTRVKGRLRPRFFLKQTAGPRRQMLSEIL